MSGVANSSYDFSDVIGPEGKYWGEIDQETMKGINEKALRDGYLEALVELVRARPDFGDYLFSDRRIDWLFHCLTNYTSRPTRVLDIGSGWGTLSFLLTKYFDEVWSAEAVYERAVFQAIRKEQTKENKAHIVRCWSHKLPFSSQFFDLAVANGLFEWIPFGDTTKDPGKLQLDFLKEAHRILKVGGCLYIGIENRIAYSYFLGTPDHSGLPFTSLLPRFLASLFVTLVGGYKDRTTALNNYATYTYSALGYKKLLALAGFNDIDVYCVTDYNFPTASWRITDDKALDYFLKKTVNSNKAKYISGFPKIVKNAINFLFPNFSIFAYKGFKPETFEGKLCGSTSFKDNRSFLKISGNSDVAYHFIDSNGRPTHVVRIPRFKDSQSNFEKKEKLMAHFNELQLQKEYSFSTSIFVEKYIEGSHFEILNPQHNSNAFKWLFDFQKATNKGYITTHEICSEIEALLNYLGTLKTNYAKDVEQNLKNIINSSHICVSEHGDFWAGNIMFNNNRTYVLDWEDYKDRGNYFFDPLFFLITNSLYTELPNELLSSFLRNWTGAGRYSPILQKNLLRLKDAFNLDLAAIINGIPYVILKKIALCDPRTNVWRNDYLLFPKLLDVWYRHENEIRRYLSVM